ncbi:MAG: peptide chain release factor N(5)-glutamine methyltransferase [Candidatus Daviesbacteria bacterium]|nr:MAG: peptide chain release factor N(5)-glutamine methyltransferase [Candidatus Daviesbacteria bacterium]
MKIKNLKLKIDQNKPIQYQKGYVEFYKLKFKLTPDILIPRPETELLVDEVIAYAKQNNHPEERNSDEGFPTLTILDLGTGAGNIAISLACNLKSCNVNILATDISPKALKVAKQNAKLHGVLDKITFIQSDLLSSIGKQKMRSFKMFPLDIIVTNLPYIPSARIPYLDSSVKDFEPHVALDGGKDGFELYRKLFFQINQQSSRQLPELQPKFIICEIDYTHGELAMSEAQKYFPEYQVAVKTDLAHKQRILKITGPVNQTK